MSPVTPLAKVELEFIFRARVFFRDRVMFPPTPRGGRGYVSIKGGDFEGPRLNGKVVPNSGADWALIRPSGTLEINAHYMLEEADGTPIYLYNTGFLQRDKAGGQPSYFIIAPTFDTRPGPHDWLTRTVILGRGTRVTNPDHTVFEYFSVKP
jgi:hypothetical protein